MTFDHYGKPIDTIEDLLQSMKEGKVKMIAENYKTSLNQYLEVIWKNIIFMQYILHQLLFVNF